MEENESKLNKYLALKGFFYWKMKQIDISWKELKQQRRKYFSREKEYIKRY
jgi:hypothetical protein